MILCDLSHECSINIDLIICIFFLLNIIYIVPNQTLENHTSMLYPFFESVSASYLIWPTVPYVKLLSQICMESRNFHILDK